jgi:5-bromo-4-chloroindolyl phosphate hydrolysis protein
MLGWLPGVSGALVFLGLLFGLGWPWWLALALGLADFVAMTLLLPRAAAKLVSDDQQDLVRLTLTEAREKLRQLQSRVGEVGTLKGELEKLIDAARRILEEVEQRPQALSRVRSFFTYYLDAAVRIVSGYAELLSSGSKDEATRKSLAKAAEMLSVLEAAFEKQLAALLQDDVMDLNTEMDLLERTMASEGWKKP